MPQTGNFENDIDLLIQNVARLYAYDGNAKIVSILSNAKISAALTDHDNWNGGTEIYSVYLEVPQRIYVEVNADLGSISQDIEEKLTTFLNRYGQIWVKIEISPQLIESKNWQYVARNWIAGEGITNQGRVRSNNIASRQCDGLLFRSGPEINIYKALKSKGVAFAPLPVFLKGGKEYSRIEPDFIIVKDGVILCLEIDGDTVHKETPAEANARTRILSNEGAIVERFQASRCETPEQANDLANEILLLLDKHKRNRP
ncbi:hypothetical protein [Acaryochloris sp. IP29b_bin.137]|uniref:hypothetical protein n=1 Tax=Acaryochloris sp. IP29b_bin.137 TaxID=2969217 RepID=UPI002605AD93|nr:hypothetical protein [Acaryochloris sp. IP29b_bin.137]